MLVKLLGLRPVEFEDEKTGNMIEGVSLYIAYPDEDVYGEIADKKFINKDTLTRLNLRDDQLIEAVGSEIDLTLNPRGKLSGIKLCKK